MAISSLVILVYLLFQLIVKLTLPNCKRANKNLLHQHGSTDFEIDFTLYSQVRKHIDSAFVALNIKL